MTKKKNTALVKHSAGGKENSMTPVIAGMVGAAVGAGVGIAGAIAMRDEKTKAKMIDVLHAVSKKANEYMDNMKREAVVQLKDKAEETLPEVKKIAAGSR